MAEEKRKIAIGLGIIAVMLTASIMGYILLRDEDGNNNGGTVNDHPVGEWTGPYLDEKNSTEQGINDIVNANNEFGIDVLKELLKEEEGNIFLSPYSIFTALSMTYEGARNNTADEMADVLHLPDNEKERLGSFAKVQNDINKGSSEYELATANAIWPKTQYEWKELFVNTIKQYYYGKVQELDYQTDPEACRKIINDWVENQTKDRIKDLIPQGAIDPLTYMVLTNAIYFKGEWVYEFNKEETSDGIFNTPDGQKEVPMMHLKVEDEDKLPYYWSDDVQAVELPYKGDELSMVLIMPNDGDIDSYVNSMTPDSLKTVFEGLSPQEGTVSMPKFKLETKYLLNDALITLGMKDAFSNADFSGMSDQGMAPYISKVIHQTFIEVDEEGTEAAAATAVIIRELSANGFSFNANNPFLYLIKQKDTDNILFMGTMKDPTQEK